MNEKLPRVAALDWKMAKRGVVLLATVCFTVGTMAQKPVSGTSNLQSAIALYQAGKAQQARKIIAGISKEDPDYAMARCYNALCLYDQKDYAGCLREVESSELQAALIPDAIRAELGCRQVGALFQLRRFEDLLPKVQAFQNEYPNSPRGNIVNEYGVAGLFERGTKKAEESCLSAETNKAQARWSEAEINLRDFLKQVRAGALSRYSALSNRTLIEEIWAARIILGEADKALTEIPARDVNSRQKFRLLQIKIGLKLREKELDENMQRMSAFLQDHPAARERKRVEFDLAAYHFKKIESSYKAAEAAENTGNPTLAAEKRAAVADNFAAFRSLQKEAVINESLGIKATDILELRSDLYHSFFLQKDFTNLFALTGSMISSSTPGDLNWILASVYKGIALQSQVPPKSTEATAIFDQIMAYDFNGKPHQDYYVLLATQWRIKAAMATGDTFKAYDLVQWVAKGKCRKDLKEKFLKLQGFIPPTKAESKPL